MSVIALFNLERYARNGDLGAFVAVAVLMRIVDHQVLVSPRRQLCDERCAVVLAKTACDTTQWDGT